MRDLHRKMFCQLNITNYICCGIFHLESDPTPLQADLIHHAHKKLLLQLWQLCSSLFMLALPYMEKAALQLWPALPAPCATSTPCLPPT